MSSLTTYYSSKLINKTNILFVLSPPLFKKKYFSFIFFFFPSLFCHFSLSPFLPIRIFFFSLLLLYFLFLSSDLFLSSSFFLFRFSLSFLILYSMLFSFFFFLFSFFFFPFSLLTNSLSLSPMDHGGGGSWIVIEIWSGFG